MVKAGSTVGLSTADGLTVHGVATIGPAGRSVTVTVDGAVAGADNWSLTVATSDAATYTPVDGFSITPNISGTVAKSDGRVHVTVTGNVDATWAVGGVSMVLSSVAFSNDAAPAGVACPDVKPGELWLDVKGALHADAIGLDAAAEGCVNLSTGAFALSTTVKTGLTPGAYGFALTDATVAVAKAPGSAVQVTAAATLAVSNPGHDDLTLPVQIALGADGSIVGGTGVDLGQLGLGSGSGTLLFASTAVPAYDASAFGIKQPVKLAAGVTVLFDYQPSKEVNQALAALQLPAVQTLRAAATLSPSGFSITASVGFGTKTSGAKLYAQDFAGGAAAYLNTLELGIATDGTDVSLSLGGTAYLVLPALYPGGQGSSIGLALNGSIDVTATAVTVNLGFDIAADNGTWSDAFGIPHLSVSRLAGKFGVTITPETAGIPTPSFAIRVDKLKLPTEWSTAIGLTSDATMSLNLALNVTNPILDVTIESSTPNAVALRPFAIAKAISNSTPDSVTHLIEVSRAHLLFAPLGGTDAANQKVYPGVALVFDGKLGGYPVHVDASVGLLPYPHLFADVNISSFKVGTVAIDNTHLTVNLDANPAKPVADLSFSGGFTDSRTGISFAANFDTGITADAANAKVALTITGGQPGYILATSTLKGSVSASSAGVSFSASGALWMYAAGQYLGQLSFTYSSNAGAVWDQFATAVGKAYHDAYNWADWQVAQTLRGYRFASTEVAKGVANVYNEGIGAVNTALTKAGYGFNDAVSAVKTYFAATDQALANSFRQAGYTANQIATVLQQFYGEGDRQAAAVLKAAGATTNEIVGALQTTFQEGQAAIYNTLQSIGSAGSTAIDALNGFFNTGAYNIWTYPPPAWAWTLGLSGSSVVYQLGQRVRPQPAVVRAADRFRLRRDRQPRQRPVPDGERLLDRRHRLAGHLFLLGAPVAAVVPGRSCLRQEHRRPVDRPVQPQLGDGRRRALPELAGRRDGGSVLGQRGLEPDVQVPARGGLTPEPDAAPSLSWDGAASACAPYRRARRSSRVRRDRGRSRPHHAAARRSAAASRSCLRMKPTAPHSTSSGGRSVVSYVEISTMRTVGRAARMRRVASTPSIPGSRTSISTTTGSARRPAAPPPRRSRPRRAGSSRRSSGPAQPPRAGTAAGRRPPARRSRRFLREIQQGGPHPGMDVEVAGQVELGEDRIDVLLHRVPGQHEMVRDRRVRAALGDLGEYLQLTRAQPRQASVVRA